MVAEQARFATRRERRFRSFTRSFGQVLLVLLLGISHLALARLPDTLPPDLQPWVDWVLADEPEHACPFIYSGDARSCAWPSRLQLSLDAGSGRFSQEWYSYRDGWLTLPGGAGSWPQGVTANGQQVPVSNERDAPAVYLPAGRYTLAGNFTWGTLPKSLPLPSTIGLVDLRVGGQVVAFPLIDPQSHALWIERRAGDEGEQGLQDHLVVQRFRKLVDDLPMRVETLLRLQVSGSQREVLLDHPLLTDGIPLAVVSPLPARLEPDGRLRVQVRPGEWDITVVGRFGTQVSQLAAPTDSAEAEVWSFQAINALRLVELSGPQALDPRQTRMPADWQQLPAYRMTPGATLHFELRRRGDPTPEPNRLQIRREAWLDFSGEGYTIRDHISGDMTSGWRLEAHPNLQLGRVELDGQPQLITQLTADASRGVEVRRGLINLESVSRWPGPIRHTDAAGWQADFTQAEMVLHMPPGWRLLSATGMDNVPGTWLQRWTLLDLFLVMITSLAVARLWGWRWAPLALVTLALLWHEPDAPRYVWLNIVAAVALLRVIPKGGRAYRLMDGYRLISLLALLLISLPFMVGEIRTGIYPQLERPYQAAVSSDEITGYGDTSRETRVLSAPAEGFRHSAAVAGKLAAELTGSVAEPPAVRAIATFDPHAMIQTGPGAPRWSWNQVRFAWNGPLRQGQAIELVFLSPGMNLLLNLLRVALLLALAARLMDRLDLGRWKPGHAINPMLVLLALCMLPPEPAQAEIPPPALLDALKQHLLQAPDCVPTCADISQLSLDVDADQIQMRLQIHAQAQVAVPLPGQAQHWLPSAVQLDGAPAMLRRDPAGVLWTLVESGVHEVVISGGLPQRTTIQIPLRLRPQQVIANVHGWTLDGLGENGQPSDQLQLTRKQVAATAGLDSDVLKPAELPPFVLVERTLHLGLDWVVETRVIRQSPTGTAAVLRVPLLPGESVTSDNVRVENDQVLVSLAAGAHQTAWRSVLQHGDIELMAPVQDWVERWLLDASPIWHISADGIPVVHHTDTQRQWLPEWRPWPGESLRLQVTRPAGVEGPTLTIEAVQLHITPGLHASDSRLHIALLASQGGQHLLRLPPDASLQSVTIDQQAQAIRQQGREVSLPITPGSHQVELNWRSNDAIQSLFRTPELDLGSPAANTSLTSALAADRWILMLGGPAMGPAVLWWGVLVVILIVALILGALPFSPLRHYQWLLLGLGLSQTDLFVPLIVAGWLLALGLRGRLPSTHKTDHFNAIQTLLALWTLVALVLLFGAIQQGLLGQPDMQVMGNQSSATVLNWYQDRTDGLYPQAWVLSVPLLVYRIAMLAWALWLAFALLKWLQWGWTNFAKDGLWRTGVKTASTKKASAAPTLPSQPTADTDPWTTDK